MIVYEMSLQKGPISKALYLGSGLDFDSVGFFIFVRFFIFA